MITREKAKEMFMEVNAYSNQKDIIEKIDIIYDSFENNTINNITEDNVYNFENLVDYSKGREDNRDILTDILELNIGNRYDNIVFEGNKYYISKDNVNSIREMSEGYVKDYCITKEYIEWRRKYFY